MKKITILSCILSSFLYSGTAADNLYLGDGFNLRHSKVKESFIKSMAKNRANLHKNGSGYIEVRGNDEFKDALKSGKLGQTSTGNGITKEYKYIDIKNVNIDKNDLKDIDDDRLLIGTKVDGKREELMQNINIENSKIDTDKKLNVGVLSTQKRVEGITTSQNIANSKLKGGKLRDDFNSRKKSRLDKFDEEF